MIIYSYIVTKERYKRKMPYFTERPPKYKIAKRITKYLFFNLILTISPILINIFISFTNQLPYRSAISYCPDICFMIIVTGSSSIRDSLISNTIRKNNFILGGLIILNVICMLFSMIIYGNITKDTLSNIETVAITFQQFIISVICYLILVVLGLGIQVGGGIDE